MIRFTCPVCESTLNAKDELAGQSRKCPKCGTSVEIPAPPADPAGVAEPDGLADAEEAPGGDVIHELHEESLPIAQLPERVNRSNNYLVCDRSQVFATWQNDGRGWILKTKEGPLTAKRNAERIPAHGNFVLVELIFADTEEGRRLEGISVYEISQRWGLPALARGDDAILRQVVRSGRLNREQKLAIRRQLQEQFMPDVWTENETVVEYLSNEDFHSPGTVSPT